jgi:hypothetical protein
MFKALIGSAAFLDFQFIPLPLLAAKIMVGARKSSIFLIRLFPLLLPLITLVVVVPVVVLGMDPPPPPHHPTHPQPAPLDQAMARRQLGRMPLHGHLSPPEAEVLVRYHQLFYVLHRYEVCWILYRKK